MSRVHSKKKKWYTHQKMRHPTQTTIKMTVCTCDEREQKRLDRAQQAKDARRVAKQKKRDDLQATYDTLIELPSLHSVMDKRDYRCVSKQLSRAGLSVRRARSKAKEHKRIERIMSFMTAREIADDQDAQEVGRMSVYLKIFYDLDETRELVKRAADGVVAAGKERKQARVADAETPVELIVE